MPVANTAPLAWSSFDGGIYEVGHDGAGFAYDNEGPRHEALIRPFKLANRCVTNGEWIDFIEDGGYRTAALWLADGWNTVQGARVAGAALFRGGRGRLHADEPARLSPGGPGARP